MSDGLEEIEVSLADMLEILASGGNGVELIDISRLLEEAATQLREKDREIEMLRALYVRRN